MREESEENLKETSCSELEHIWARYDKITERLKQVKVQLGPLISDRPLIPVVEIPASPTQDLGELKQEKVQLGQLILDRPLIPVVGMPASPPQDPGEKRVRQMIQDFEEKIETLSRS